MASKHGLEHPQQRRPLLALRGPPRHPSTATTANPTELKAQKSEAFALREVDTSTLILVHRHLEFGKLLAEPSFHRRSKPGVSRMRVHQYHEIVSEARVFHARPLFLAGDSLRSFQHDIHLIEVDVTEQRRNHATLRNALR
jgi:hypothetical protein